MSKTYANRSNARRAAKTAGLELDTLDFVTDNAGQWYWVANEPEVKVIATLSDGSQLVSYSDVETPGAYAPRYKLHRRKPKAAVAAATPAAATVQAPALPATVPAHKVFQVHGKSKIVSPVKVVHDFLDANGADLTRKQALFQLAQLGVNYATARTQYQRWFAAKK